MKPIIKVDNLSKKYYLGKSAARYGSLRDTIVETITNPFRKKNKKTESIWALRDINFEVKPGEIIGIIGRNGAGKSTLLKILSRITEPTTGEINLYGRVGSLLEVGTGFHPELTGRENIFLNGAVLGMKRKEIERKFDEIVAFAEVEKFLDTSVKYYSSGMYMRLAFGVAAHLEPEILIVDEVLAVGDAQFQKKCLGKMKDVSQHGRTVLFVSHNMSAITSLCQKSILLESGQITEIGPTSDVILHYFNSSQSSPAHFDFSKSDRKIGDEYVSLIGGSVLNQRGEVTAEIDLDESFNIEMHYQIKKESNIKFVPNFHFLTADGSYVFFSSTQQEVVPTGIYIVRGSIPSNLLNDGTYFVGLAISSFESGVKVHFHEQNVLSFNVRDSLESEVNRYGYMGRIPGIVRPHLKWETKKIA